MSRDERAFRVVILIPAGLDAPAEYEEDDDTSELPDKSFFVSKWFSTILEAESSMIGAARFYSKRSVRFVLFRELRKPRQVAPVLNDR
ncbi:MAG: hypothetical protein QXS20_06440 [Candidatus Thorarchaeota archaeon]